MKDSLFDLLVAASSQQVLTKQEFGRIMHDPNASEEEKNEALRMMQEADGYENLAD